MILTLPWLKEHLKTNANENEIINKLTNIGLEVESVKENSGELSKFKIAKLIKAEKHPNADKLKVCDVNIGGKETLKVVCGAPNARDGLITIYAPPGAIIPKTKFQLKIAKIRKDKLNLNKNFYVFTGSTVGVVPIGKGLYKGKIEKLGSVKTKIN